MSLSTKKHLLAVLLLITLSFIAYGNTLSSPFVYDDENYIVLNPLVKTFHYLANPSEVFTLGGISPTYQTSFNTRILGYLSFAINYYIGGVNVWGYHAVNMAIHAANAVLVYFLIILTLGVLYLDERFRLDGSALPDDQDFFISILAAALFCVHPVNTSGVTYISQRFASMVTFFYLLAFVSFIKYRISRAPYPGMLWYAMALISTVSAMLTKENAFTLPYLLVIYDFIFFRPGKKKLWNHIPLLLASLIVPLSVARIQGILKTHYGMNAVHVLGVSDNVTSYDYFITQFRVLLTYLRLVFFPSQQKVFYDLAASHSINDPLVLAGGFVFLCIIAAAACLWFIGRHRGKRYFVLAFFGIVWFLVTLSIESSFIPNINLLMEYRLYLPLPGFIIAVISPLVEKIKIKKLVTVIALTAAVIILTAATVYRNSIWRSDITLWEDNVAKSPNSAQAHHFLAVAYLKSGKLYPGMSHTLRALELKPKYIESRINLGLIYSELGYYDDAIIQLSIAQNLTMPYGPLADMIREVTEKRDAALRGKRQIPAPLTP